MLCKYILKHSNKFKITITQIGFVCTEQNHTAASKLARRNKRILDFDGIPPGRWRSPFGIWPNSLVFLMYCNHNRYIDYNLSIPLVLFYLS